MTHRKGILLAGGTGTRLYPLTVGISKQLLPIYDKPTIYYALSVLMLAGIREIAVITTPEDQAQFQRVLGDGSQWGIALTWIVQPAPEGIAQAYLLAEDFLAGAPSALALGDNVFYGSGLSEMLMQANRAEGGAIAFGCVVSDPERYGVFDFAPDGSVRDIVEKPDTPPSDCAVTGLYFLDGSAPERAKSLRPSARGELEITDLLRSYLRDGLLSSRIMDRGFAWLDTGTHQSLLEAGNFVQTLAARQGLQIGNLDEIAYRKGWIDAEALRARGQALRKSDYGAYLLKLLAQG